MVVPIAQAARWRPARARTAAYGPLARWVSVGCHWQRRVHGFAEAPRCDGDSPLQANAAAKSIDSTKSCGLVAWVASLPGVWLV